MIRRLIAYILIACLAAPAVAAPMHCADQAAPVAMTHDHGQPDPSHGDHAPPASSSGKHDCIGCIAPFAPVMDPERPVRPRPLLAEQETHFNALPLQRPETPPPRS